MPELSKSEKKLIYQQYFYPVIAAVSIGMAMGLGVPWAILEMLEGMVFKAADKGSYLIGWDIYFGFAALFLVAMVYCLIAIKFGKKRRAAWGDLVQRARAHVHETDHSGQVAASAALMAAGRLAHKSSNETASALGDVAQAAGAVGVATGVIGACVEAHETASEVARSFGLKMPKVGKLVAAMIAVPLIVLVGSYIPRFAYVSDLQHAQMATAAKSIDTLRDAFEAGGCVRVSAEDPTEEWDDTYSMCAYLREWTTDSGYSRDVSLTIWIDNYGKVDAVFYDEDIDINKSTAENLAQVEADFAQLHGMLANAQVEGTSSSMISSYELSDKFKESFLAGTYYDELRVYTHDIGAGDYFDTDPEEDFDEDSCPCITHHVS